MAKRGRKKAVAKSLLEPKGPQKPNFADRLLDLSTQEVERRVAAIQAIQAAEVESLLSRIRLIRSYFNKEQLETPALQFFKENLPNISIMMNAKHGILEMMWKDKEGDGLESQVVGGIPLSVSLAKSFSWDIANLQIPDLVLDEQSENQKRRTSGVFQTPGETSYWRSSGMTPKTSRLPKKGELLMSIRGSPLGVYNLENLETIHDCGDGSCDNTSQ